MSDHNPDFESEDRWCRRFQRNTLIQGCVLYALAPLRGEDPRFYLDNTRGICRMAEMNRIHYHLHHGDNPIALQDRLRQLKQEEEMSASSPFMPPSFRAMVEDSLDESNVGKAMGQVLNQVRHYHDDGDLVRQVGAFFKRCDTYVHDARVTYPGQARIQFEKAHESALRNADKLAGELEVRHNDFKGLGLAEHFRTALNMAREVVLSESTIMLEEALQRVQDQGKERRQV